MLLFPSVEFPEPAYVVMDKVSMHFSTSVSGSAASACFERRLALLRQFVGVNIGGRGFTVSSKMAKVSYLRGKANPFFPSILDVPWSFFAERASRLPIGATSWMILGCSSWYSGKSVLFLVHVLSILGYLYGLVDDYKADGIAEACKSPDTFLHLRLFRKRKAS